MKDFVKKVRGDLILSSLVCITLGALFIIFHAHVFTWITITLGIVMVSLGIVLIAGMILDFTNSKILTVAGGVLLLLGIALLIFRSYVFELVPIVIGVILIFHGIRGTKESLDTKKFGNNLWGIGLAASLLCVIFGVICIVQAFGILKLVSVFIGLMLIFNGLSSIWIAGLAAVSERKYNGTHPIDVDFVDDEE